MTKLTQNKTPEESNIDQKRRSLLKALIGGAAGLAFATGVPSSAFAKRRRRSGQGNSNGNNNSKGKGKHRHHP